MEIIDRLHNQLSIIKAILIKEIESGSYTLNYNICETEYKFLDKYELRKYLTKEVVENKIFLKFINEACLFIINSLENELKSIPYKELKENLVVQGEFKDIFTKIDFHAFHITNKRIIQYNGISAKIDFVKNYDYTFFDIYEIANRCNLILNWITASYPETIPDSLKQPCRSSKNEPQQTEIKKTKSLEQFITNVENKQSFLKDLKETFPTEIGKSIKAIIDLLVSDNIIIYGTREFKQLYNQLKLVFDRDIGTYQSIQNVKEVDAVIIDIIHKNLIR